MISMPSRNSAYVREIHFDRDFYGAYVADLRVLVPVDVRTDAICDRNMREEIEDSVMEVFRDHGYGV